MDRMKDKKPNLLFLYTDEQAFNTLACYGNDWIEMPNLNALAEQSVVFDRAYVTQPVCTPSRSTLMTGQWPHTNGCVRNNVPLQPATKCLPELLPAGEYVTGHYGKWHLGDEIFRQHGFDEWANYEDNYVAYYGPGRDRSERSAYHHYLLEQGYMPDSEDRNLFSRGFCCRLPEEHGKPAWIARRVVDFIERHRDETFALFVNFLEPHMPFFGPLDDLHDPDEIDFPDNSSDPLENNEPLRYRVMLRNCQKKYGKTEKELRELYAKYHGLVAQVDRSVGKILKTLDELGLKDNTIVVYTSDHGDMMGAHGLVMKTYMYEESTRVPWLMRVPKMGFTQNIIENPVSHIDLVPTLLDLLDKNTPDYLPGQSLVPLINGGAVKEDHVFIEWNPHPGRGGYRRYMKKGRKLASDIASAEDIEKVAGEKTRAIVSPDGWKLCLSDVDKCQLFDLNNDPLETTNLFDSGKHDDIIKRLTAKIHAWQKSVGDDIKV